jgi:hypothetical protein
MSNIAHIRLSLNLSSAVCFQNHLIAVDLLELKEESKKSR